MKPKSNRLLAAILIAPLVVPALFFIFIIAFAGISASREAVEFVAFTTPVSYAGFMVLGLPSFFALRHTGRVTIWALLIAGAVWGTITMFVFATLLFGVSTWKYATLGNYSGASSLGCWSRALCGNNVLFYRWHNTSFNPDARNSGARRLVLRWAAQI